MRAACAAVVTLVAVGGCRACAEDAAPPPSSSAFFPAPTFTRAGVVTDDAASALAAAADRASLLKSGAPADLDALGAALDDAILVAHVRGAVDDILLVLRAANDAEAENPRHARLAAKAWIALGRYGRARSAAAAMDGTAPDAREIECDIALGLGELDAALEHARAVGAARPGAEASLRIARVLAARSEVEAADLALLDAERAFDGGSPFLLADIYFTRGDLWERAGDLVKATALYREAVARVPMHAGAAAHLASLLPLAEASTLLEPLAARGGGPEVTGALGVYRELLRTGDGARDTTRASADYARLVGGATPAAPIVANHAGWFFFRVTSDVAGAKSAARVDLAEHPSADAFTLALAVLDAPEDRDERCRVAASARAFTWPSAALVEALRHLGDCPR